MPSITLICAVWDYIPKHFAEFNTKQETVYDMESGPETFHGE